jgi:hypothetical protein
MRVRVEEEAVCVGRETCDKDEREKFVGVNLSSKEGSYGGFLMMKNCSQKNQLMIFLLII